MLRCFVVYAFLLNILMATQGALPSENLLSDSTDSSDCLTNSLEDSLYCRGSRAIRNVIHNLSRNDKPIIIVRGLEIVPSKDPQDSTLPTPLSSPDSDDSVLGRFSEYLRTHELNIKFSDLLTEESERYSTRDLEQNGANVVSSGAEEARKKDKGQGMLLAVAVMFAKMMAMLGLGGIGAMAMKALGVAMAALTIAGLVGVKSLSQQGHESSHSVQYVTAEGHHHNRRRRRSASTEFSALPLVYRGWSSNAAFKI